MIVAGWADGYRNNTFRTVAGLGEAGTPWRLLAGPWAHADPATAIPGPRIDLDHEMVAWWDRWLRGTAPGRVDRPRRRLRPHLDGARAGSRAARGVLGVRAVAGRRRRRSRRTTSTGRATLVVEPDVGTAAWIDCAGHLPWGLSGDQREDDARSLTWEWDAQPPLVGQPSLALDVSASAELASLSVKLCDVFPDGTSALITRGTLDLAGVGEAGTWSCSSTRAPTGRTPATGSASRSPAPTGRTRSPRPGRSPSPCTAAR